jgi:large-conductance mechanosensitive channel
VAPLNLLAARRAVGQEPVPADEVPADVALLTEIRDLLAGRPTPPSNG